MPRAPADSDSSYSEQEFIESSDSDPPLSSNWRAPRGKPTALTRKRESFETDSDIVFNQKPATLARNSTSSHRTVLEMQTDSGGDDTELVRDSIFSSPSLFED
jgi:hypothetical protein